MGIDVPSQVEDITADWLNREFRLAGFAFPAVVEITSERIGEGVGFIGQLHRLTVSYADEAAATDGSAPTSLIAKMPTNDPGGRMLGTMMRLYEKESGFYGHLAADCPVRIPQCFYNGAAPDAQQWCLLLEDLGHYVVGDQLVGRDLPQSRTLVQTLARIHARWSDGRADEHDWLPQVDDPGTVGMLSMYDACLPAAMERYGHLVPPHMLEWGQRFLPVAAQWLADFARQPSTIIHGDFRTDNLVFSPDSPHDDFVLLDWQLTSRSPGAYDLYYFLALSADPSVACDHLDELVDLYLGELSAAGASAPTRDTLLEQMRGVGLFFSLLGVVTLASLDSANPRGEELFLTMWQRGIRFAERLDLSLVLP